MNLRAVCSWFQASVSWHHARKEKGAGYQLGSYTEIHFGFVFAWHTIYFFNIRTYMILANTQPVSKEKYVEAATSPNLCFTLGYFLISLSWNTVSYNSPHQFKDYCVSFIISLIHCVFTSITTNFNILLSFLFCSFETEFYSVGHASLKLILLLQPPIYQHHSYAPPSPAKLQV